MTEADGEKPKHQYFRVGDIDCPREIKARNGELHTLRCRICGQDDPRDDACFAAGAIVGDKAEISEHELEIIGLNASVHYLLGLIRRYVSMVEKDCEDDELNTDFLELLNEMRRIDIPPSSTNSPPIAEAEAQTVHDAERYRLQRDQLLAAATTVRHEMNAAWKAGNLPAIAISGEAVRALNAAIASASGEAI